MKITVSSELSGPESVNGFLKALSKVMNEYVVGSSSKIDLSVPDGEYDDTGLYTVKIDVEFETTPHELFKERSK